MVFLRKKGFQNILRKSWKLVRNRILGLLFHIHWKALERFLTSLVKCFDIFFKFKLIVEKMNCKDIKM